MDFSLTEKLAITKALAEIITADGKVAVGELAYYKQIANVIGLNDHHLEQSAEMNINEAIYALSGMNTDKKAALAIMMREMALADGSLDKRELEVIASVFIASGIDIKQGKVVA
jgi:uncharacterized tellurite resistance protein B-like protein